MSKGETSLLNSLYSAYQTISMTFNTKLYPGTVRPTTRPGTRDPSPVLGQLGSNKNQRNYRGHFR